MIILAAGKGTRMRSNIPKILHPLAGRPMIDHVLRTANELEPKQICIVYSEQTKQLRKMYQQKNIVWALQKEQKGTGHAVALALRRIQRPTTALILCADTPAITAKTLRKAARKRTVSIVTTMTDQPHGYGRVIRKASVQRIVEEADATEEQKKITEVYTGILAADADDLIRWQAMTKQDNRQKEFYLPDVIEICAKEGGRVSATQADHQECQGINTRQQLHDMERHMQAKKAEELMNKGVTIMDTSRLDIRGTVHAGKDCTIDTNVILEGTVTLGSNSSIGANCTIKDTTIGSNTTIHPNTIIDGARIGKNATIGPFARIRPSTTASANTRIGNFVELKQATINQGTKISHLSYVGDATIGQDTNIGAGAITCNYDGKRKHQTKIGSNASIGANANLIAPITIGSNTTIGAGSTITTDIPANTTAVERAKQRTIRRPKRSR